MTDIIPVERIVFYLFFYHVNPPQHVYVRCVITAIKSMEGLAFTWKGTDQFTQLMNLFS